MKSKETMVVWDRESGAVEVGLHPRVDQEKPNWHQAYPLSSGAAWADWKKDIPADHFNGHSDAEIKHGFLWFREFVHLVVREGLDPKAVYEQFIKVDEFEVFLDQDMPGVKS